MHVKQFNQTCYTSNDLGTNTVEMTFKNNVKTTNIRIADINIVTLDAVKVIFQPITVKEETISMDGAEGGKRENNASPTLNPQFWGH